MESLRPPVGAVKRKRCVGRGNGSKGGTSGRGDKGQNARSGGGVRVGFEGGQMPLYRRIPRRGFSNYPFKKEYKIVHLRELALRFEDGDTVDFESLKARGLVSGRYRSVKILSGGDLDKRLIVKVDKVTKSAREKIESARGEIVLIEVARNGR